MALALRRILAFMIDWCVIALWGGALFAVVMLATGGEPSQASNPWVAQGIGFLAMTLPVALYFTLCESSRWQGTLGKRVLGLRVTDTDGGRLPFGCALMRNAIKFAPWEAGHIVAQQAAFSGDAGLPLWVWAPAAISLIGPLVWVITMFTNGRTPYDRWSGAQVIRGT